MNTTTQTPRRAAPEFSGEKLRHARLARGMSPQDLAALAGCTRQAISYWERGERQPEIKNVVELAVALDLSVTYFAADTRGRSFAPESILTFRSFRSSTRKQRQQAEGLLSWVALCYSKIDELVELPALRLPLFEIPLDALDDQEAIEDVASETRHQLGLGDGPIRSVVTLLENCGVWTGEHALERQLDALSGWVAGRPIVLATSQVPWARSRFNLAHELGHLVMHRSVSAEEQADPEIFKRMEAQADRFAAAFLLPDRTFPAECFSLSIEALTELKKRWGASMQAMAYRMRSLDLISEGQFRTFQMRMSAAGFRRCEPLDRERAPERPTLLNRLIESVKESDSRILDDLTTLAPIQLKEFASLLGSDTGKLLAHQGTAKVIQFRRRESDCADAAELRAVK